MAREAPLDATVSSTLTPTTRYVQSCVFPRLVFPFLLEVLVGWTDHTLLLSHDSFATQNGVQAPGTYLHQNLLPHPRYPESESVSQQGPCLTCITGDL